MRRPLTPPALAAFALGVVVGAAAVTPYAAHEAEALRLALRARQADLAACQEEVGHLKDEARRLAGGGRLTPTVRTVTVSVEGVDPVTSLTLAEAATALLAPLTGRPLDRIDLPLLTALVDRRLLPAEDRLYRLRLRYALVAPEATVVLVAVPVEP